MQDFLTDANTWAGVVAGLVLGTAGVVGLLWGLVVKAKDAAVQAKDAIIQQLHAANSELRARLQEGPDFVAQAQNVIALFEKKASALEAQSNELVAETERLQDELRIAKQTASESQEELARREAAVDQLQLHRAEADALRHRLREATVLIDWVAELGPGAGMLEVKLPTGMFARSGSGHWRTRVARKEHGDKTGGPEQVDAEGAGDVAAEDA